MDNEDKRHLHLISELSNWIKDELVGKLSQVDTIRSSLEQRKSDLKVPERSFTFGLEMINHVFDTVTRQIELEKTKIMDEFRQLIDKHCKEKFDKKAKKVSKELEKCSNYLKTVTQGIDNDMKSGNHAEICQEYTTVNFLTKTVKKFEDSIMKAEKYAIFCENDYQFVFQKDDFSTALKKVIE